MRKPKDVMRLARMGSSHAHRLSFMRILLRRLRNEKWQITRPVFDIDARGVGTAVYTAKGPDRSYSLVAFGHDLDPNKRSDRVIADAWDSTFALFDGVPSTADIDRLRDNVPLQEAGRVSQTELCLSRANRSGRLFKYVIDCLCNGEQPKAEELANVGYLMRTTAVYGSGKFGAKDRFEIADRPECAAPFQVEMLSVYLIRTYVGDLIDAMAQKRSEKAVTLDKNLRRSLGIGNSTGLGMAPFLLNHPSLLNNWILARETAIARVCDVKIATEKEIAIFADYVKRARIDCGKWVSAHSLQQQKILDLLADQDNLNAFLSSFDWQEEYPWRRLMDWAHGALGFEGQEQLSTLILEPYGHLVDDLADTLSIDEQESFSIDGQMTLDELRSIIDEMYDFATKVDWDCEKADARAWYVSENKLEPRLGERHSEGLTPFEQPLSPARDVARLRKDLEGEKGGLGEFLLRHFHHRQIVRRVQLVAKFPYAEIRDNTISADLLPIDLLRAKLAFFGAGRFDPRSDRWVRINMFQNAPLAEELLQSEEDAWIYPPLEENRHA